MATAVLDNIELYYEIQGTGNPLMLIAGLGSDSQSWQPIIGDLSSRHTVITLDNRGTGRTMPQDADLTIEIMADDCLSLLDHLGISSASLLGHSMGGLIAMDCAVRRPEAVDRLILAGTSARISRRNIELLSDWATHLEAGMDPVLWFKNIFYWVMSERFFENEAAMEEALLSELAYPYPINKVSFRKQVSAIAAFDGVGHPAKITAKTLVIAGKKDLLIPPEECEELAGAIPAAFCLLDRAPHSLFLEDPVHFSRLVLEFLSEE